MNRIEMAEKAWEISTLLNNLHGDKTAEFIAIKIDNVNTDDKIAEILFRKLENLSELYTHGLKEFI